VRVSSSLSPGLSFRPRGRSLTVMIEVLLSILSAALSMVIGGTIISRVFEPVGQYILDKLGVEREKHRPSYAERLHTLTESLRKASEDVDVVLQEIAQVAHERAAAVAALEQQVEEMASREEELKRRIDDLANVPLPVAEHFAALTAAGEKRSAKRDYLLFGLGVLLSTLLSVIFFLLQG
jgi:cell division protein FtsB